MLTSNSDTTLTSQVRTNALSSYFFLGFLYLLAYKNPNFNHPFVRLHAWAATRVHIMLIGFVVVYKYLLSGLLTYSIPVIRIPISRLVFSAAFLLIFFLLFRGAYLAYRGASPKDTPIFTPDNRSGDTLAHETIRDEADIARTLLSFLPFIWVFIAERFSTPLTRVGSKVSGYGSILLIFETVFLHGENLELITIFLLILLLVTTGVFLISGKSVMFLSPVQYLPSFSEVQIFLNTLPGYLSDVFAVIIGKKQDLSFSASESVCTERMKKSEQDLEKYFNNALMVFSPYLIYVPVINLIFLYQFFSPKKSRYVLAVNQGIVMTLLALGVWSFSDTSELLMLFFLPMMLGIATVSTRPFLQIPVLYELGALLSSITFGIVSGTKQAREKSNEVREVRLKVE